MKFEQIKNKLKKVGTHQFLIGCDPELFIERKGKIIGSEKVLSKGKRPQRAYLVSGRIVEDGVQVELNPPAVSCREAGANRIREQIGYLNNILKYNSTLFSPYKVTSKVCVEVSKSQYESLSEKNKKFGCEPSFSAPSGDVNEITIDPSTYLYRHAGGHIHLGTTGASPSEATAIRSPERLIPVLDIILGNTCVLLDRDEGNIERRKYYGRAGEYRTPAHGIEYRTLSNFWLRGAPLYSFVMGLARQAVAIVAGDQDKLLLELVDRDDIIKAINNNDYELAKKNWDKYKEFLLAVTPSDSSLFVFNSQRKIDNFEYVIEQGIDEWFSEDIINNWVTGKRRIMGGWNSFQGYINDHRERQGWYDGKN